MMFRKNFWSGSAETKVFRRASSYTKTGQIQKRRAEGLALTCIRRPAWWALVNDQDPAGRPPTANTHTGGNPTLVLAKD